MSYAVNIPAGGPRRLAHKLAAHSPRAAPHQGKTTVHRILRRHGLIEPWHAWVGQPEASVSRIGPQGTQVVRESEEAESPIARIFALGEVPPEIAVLPESGVGR